MRLSHFIQMIVKRKAIPFSLLAWLIFTTIIALSRIASGKTSIPTILFFQYTISAIVMLPWVMQKKEESLPLAKIGIIVIRSLAGFVNYAFIFLAVQRIPLVNVVLLSNSTPLFIPLIIWMWKKVRISRRLCVGILTGFLGIALILKPSNEIFNTGALFGIGSALCLSISMITQRRLVKKFSVHLINFHYFLIGAFISIPFMVENWQPIDLQTVWLLGAIGILFVTGSFFFASTFKLEKPSFLSAFSYSSIVYGALIDWTIWGHFPGWIGLIGITIVCTGGLITLGLGKGWRKKALQEEPNEKIAEIENDPPPSHDPSTMK